jgi:hypothetical protein
LACARASCGQPRIHPGKKRRDVCATPALDRKCVEDDISKLWDLLARYNKTNAELVDKNAELEKLLPGRIGN